MTKTHSEPCPDGCHVDNYTDYDKWGGCGTPYCGGWHELHCRLCGWYTMNCQCGSNNGWSKISADAWKAIEKRKKKK